MCGIVGYLSSRAPVSMHQLVSMRDTMAHRGPDGEGIWHSDDGLVGLGHRRLAIVDLSAGGHQPMPSHDGRLVITYNGEIYNHHELRETLRELGWAFRSTSDTEVLLAAYQQWGEAALDRLSGMFAFAIYDREARKLFAARDRAGEKPFFYRHADRRLIFASELKAILAHPEMPRKADPIALDHFLAYGYVPRELCMLTGYAKLPAGHKLRYDIAADRLEVEPYWHLPQWKGGVAEPMEALLDAFEPLFDTAVRRQLDADVPVAVLLSGGLDSSLVAATAARVSSKVTTFTIGFPDHPGFDESPIARRLAGELGTEHVELSAEADTADLLPSLAAQFDEPISDSSMIPTFLVSRLVRSKARVALGGDGGDELFGGYRQYGWAQRIARFRRLGLHHLGMSGPAAKLLPYGFPLRKMALRLVDPYDPALTVSRLAEPRQRRALIGDTAGAAEHYRAALMAGRHEPRDRAMALDFQTYMCDDILVKVDRASMLTSLELRAPLLDPAIIEFAFGRLAPHQRTDGNRRKLLLRSLARRRLPDWFDSHRKQGFSIPLAAWLRGPWASLLEDLAAGAGDGLLDPAGVRHFLRQDKSVNMAQQVYALAMLEMWRREYRVTME
ncbi:asparagine synthase (glutamine-hydrolyzing) [Sphingomonas naasensis]|nr:asparagine synthase (glutamine-hydrolyzing) [Sphingomonas naasensis]